MKSLTRFTCSFSTLSQVGVTLEELLSLVCPLNAFFPRTFSLILTPKAEFSGGTKLRLQKFPSQSCQEFVVEELQRAGDSKVSSSP